MLHYARADTHFLLYIYDNLRNALVDRAQSRAATPGDASDVKQSDAQRDPAHTLVYEVLRRSEETALRVYEKAMYDFEDGTGLGGWDALAKKWNKTSFTNSAAAGVQKEVYKAVHAWRDRTSREEDESPR